tara:strand:+ start:879 stop:1391 length:513 start_codon:yes stop_codon:yes gene_type:complete
MNKKILITGGAGFIGSAVIRHIIENTNYIVINVDKLTYAGNLESLSSISNDKRYIFEQIDICNSVKISKIFKTHQPDFVIHLAAESHVDRSIDGPAKFIQTNIIGTYVLLEASRDYWMSLDGDKKKDLDFTMFQLMRYMVIWVLKMNHLQKKHPTLQVLLILQQRQVLII